MVKKQIFIHKKIWQWVKVIFAMPLQFSPILRLYKSIAYAFKRKNKNDEKPEKIIIED